MKLDPYNQPISSTVLMIFIGVVISGIISLCGINSGLIMICWTTSLIPSVVLMEKNEDLGAIFCTIAAGGICGSFTMWISSSLIILVTAASIVILILWVLIMVFVPNQAGTS